MGILQKNAETAKVGILFAWKLVHLQPAAPEPDAIFG
jgi:hypothetical protein